MQPALLVVQLVVVLVAEQDEVVEVGGSAVGPVDDVVGLALGWPAVAAGDDAFLVPGDQRPPLGGGDGSAEPAEFEPFGFAAEVGGADVGVAEQPEQRPAGE